MDIRVSDGAADLNFWAGGGGRGRGEGFWDLGHVPNATVGGDLQVVDE